MNSRRQQLRPLDSASIRVFSGRTLVHIAGQSVAIRPANAGVGQPRRGERCPRSIQQVPRSSVTRVSPDGRRIVTVINQAGNEDIWMDVARVRTRLTTGPERDIFPFSLVDTRQCSNLVRIQPPRRNALLDAGHGTGMAEPLTGGELKPGPELLVAGRQDTRIATHPATTTNYDIWTLLPGQKPVPFANTAFRNAARPFPRMANGLPIRPTNPGRDRSGTCSLIRAGREGHDFDERGPFARVVAERPLIILP